MHSTYDSGDMAADLARRFQQVRLQTERLAQPLSAEDCQLQSMPDASPAKWHLAHVTWFFETFVLERFEAAFAPFDVRFRVLFNSYYNGIGDKHPRAQRGLISRPMLQDVMAYRAQVEARVLKLLTTADQGVPSDLAPLITLGLHHEQQHQELLLTDIQHALSFNPQQPAYMPPQPPVKVKPQPMRWHAYSGGLVRHGFDAQLDGAFAFDNETPRHHVFIAPFELASRPVSNGEMMAFMADGGYQRPELWLSMGWDWVTAGARQLPLYWQGSAGDFRHFTLQGLLTVDPDAPACHLSYFEADAFSRWAGARLPTEFEWELAARALASTARQPANFSDQAALRPMPQPQGDDAPAQLYGGVWEWTQSNYNPYPGYKAWEGVVGEYNGKFMCNQFVLRGGSCATPQSHIRASYRNFFPPDAQWQFSGLRLARDV
ncbi:MAG: ergothioneine biosynthesis protein EgtB [Polaromonas sp.]|nr:ergothioneine biosynthesis protein EgtB [Polaromonas sp.]